MKRVAILLFFGLALTGLAKFSSVAAHGRRAVVADDAGDDGGDDGDDAGDSGT